MRNVIVINDDSRCTFCPNVGINGVIIIGDLVDGEVLLLCKKCLEQRRWEWAKRRKPHSLVMD